MRKITLLAAALIAFVLISENLIAQSEVVTRADINRNVKVNCGDINDVVQIQCDLHRIVHFEDGVPKWLKYKYQRVEGQSTVTGENFIGTGKQDTKWIGASFRDRVITVNWNLIGDSGSHYFLTIKTWWEPKEVGTGYTKIEEIEVTCL